jgi:hypothetical protein
MGKTLRQADQACSNFRWAHIVRAACSPFEKEDLVDTIIAGVKYLMGGENGADPLPIARGEKEKLDAAAR